MSAEDRPTFGFGVEVLSIAAGETQPLGALSGNSAGYSDLRSTSSTDRGGSGSMSLASLSPCRNVSGVDLFTGLRFSKTFCDFEVSFEFTATNESGDTVSVSDGYLSGTLQRR